MNYLSLNELIEKRKEEIISSGLYSKYFYEMVCRNLKQLLLFLKDKNIDYDEVSKEEFLNYQKSIKKHKEYLYSVYAVETIDGLENISITTNHHLIATKRNNIVISNYNQEILEKYKLEISEYNCNRTINEKIKSTISIMKFFEENGIKKYEELDVKIIRKFIDTYKNDTYYNKKKYNWTLRSLLTFLYEFEYANINYSYVVDKLKYVAPKSLKTVWKKEEIEKIVENLSNDTPTNKRNKAMVLLAIRLGIRFIDIKNLKFSNINWKENTLTFIQRKTKVEITLPLTEDVGQAIIDYIKNGRPNVKSKNIFVTHDGNASNISDGMSLIEYLNKVYESANIDYKSKEKRGMHTFRHTLASQMLKNGTPQDIITLTLGHVNNESDRTYLKIDVDSLKQCCLEDEDYE